MCSSYSGYLRLTPRPRRTHWCQNLRVSHRARNTQQGQFTAWNTNIGSHFLQNNFRNTPHSWNTRRGQLSKFDNCLRLLSRNSRYNTLHCMHSISTLSFIKSPRTNFIWRYTAYTSCSYPQTSCTIVHTPFQMYSIGLL